MGKRVPHALRREQPLLQRGLVKKFHVVLQDYYIEAVKIIVLVGTVKKAK